MIQCDGATKAGRCKEQLLSPKPPMAWLYLCKKCFALWRADQRFCR
jgi:hypothetical protein